MTINKSVFKWLGVTVLTFLLTLGYEAYQSKDHLLNQYVELITADLESKQHTVEQVLQDTAFVRGRLQDQPVNLELVSTLSATNFNICFYEADSLVAWTRLFASPPDWFITGTIPLEHPTYVHLKSGHFVLEKHTIPFQTNKKYQIISVIPVKWDYTWQLDHVLRRFEASESGRIIPPAVEVLPAGKSDFQVLSDEGQPMFAITKEGQIQDRVVLRWLLAGYLLGFFFLAVLINEIARQLIRHPKKWLSPAFLLITVFGLRILSLDWSVRFSELRMFSRSFDNPHISVGDLLINIVLLLWIVIFVHRVSKNKSLRSNFSVPTRFFLTTMNYLSIVLALLLLISVIKSLVLNSGIDFDFQNIFQLDQYHLGALISLALLLFTQFVFSLRMMFTIRKLGLSTEQRIGASVTAIVLSIPIIYMIDLQIPLLLVSVVAFVFTITYDLFVDVPSPGLIWLSGWVILFSALSAGLLYKYNQDEEEKTLSYISKELSDPSDSIGLKQIHLLADQLEVTPAEEGQEIDQQIKQLFFTNNYLYSNYTLTLSEVDTISDFDVYLSEKFPDYALVKEASEPSIYQYVSQEETGFFLSFFVEKEQRSRLFQIKKAHRPKPKFYTKLLLDGNYKNLHRLVNYNYAIIRNDKLVVDEGISSLKPDIDFFPEPGAYGFGNFEDTFYFIYRSQADDYVVLSRPADNIFHPVSLFSSIFSVLVVMILFFAIINSRLKILPDKFNFDFWNKPSLKNRIQFSTILLTLLSFVIIGLVSAYLLRFSYINYNQSRLARKSANVKTTTEQFLRFESDRVEDLKQHIDEVSRAQRIDINLYDLNGHLLQSSNNDIFTYHILDPRMNAYALEFYQQKNSSDFIPIPEIVGDDEYTAVYCPVFNADGERVAFIGIPYENPHRSLQSDISDFMGNLLNVYVFLLIIAGSISVSVANTITRSISTIGDNLKELKLEKQNKLLEWHTNDEIGALISEYNKMVIKLEHSARLLARSEREGAWREMAKQVAHEIKNPLTPMKLSIQYLQHALRSNPERIEPLVKRVSNTLIEQIDSLAQIASEFSNFAKMPRANNQQIKLNDIVESVHDLFKKVNHADILLNLPEEDYFVFADKNHLTRVLNNLIKNAVEAVPDNRRGKIEVSLYQKDHLAVVKVEDNGVGIPEDMREKVFVPNFTTKNSGTGLGLAISKNIIESISGRIYFETESNVGTRFFIELPLEEMVLEKPESALS